MSDHKSKVHDTPSEVSAEEGEVMVDGPGGIAVSLTPEAALETSDRLADTASEAADQRHSKRAKGERAGLDRPRRPIRRAF